MKNILVILLTSLLVLSCSSKKNVTNNSVQNVHRVWMLVAFKDYKKEYCIEKNAFLDMTNSKSASSKMGCNALSFPYKIMKSDIRFSDGISTEMACLDMKLENDFSQSILTITSFLVNGHTLTLFSKEGTQMVFVAQDWD